MQVYSCEKTNSWSETGNCKVCVGGTWKQCTSIHCYTEGAWKKVWPITTITISGGSYNAYYTSDETTTGAKLISSLPGYISALATAGDCVTSWCIPTGSTLTVCVVAEDGTLLTKYGATYTRYNNSLYKYTSLLNDELLPAGTYTLTLHPDYNSVLYHDVSQIEVSFDTFIVRESSST